MNNDDDDFDYRPDRMLGTVMLIIVSILAVGLTFWLAYG